MQQIDAYFVVMVHEAFFGMAGVPLEQYILKLTKMQVKWRFISLLISKYFKKIFLHTQPFISALSQGGDKVVYVDPWPGSSHFDLADLPGTHANVNNGQYRFANWPYWWCECWKFWLPSNRIDGISMTQRDHAISSHMFARPVLKLSCHFPYRKFVWLTFGLSRLIWNKTYVRIVNRNNFGQRHTRANCGYAIKSYVVHRACLRSRSLLSVLSRRHVYHCSNIQKSFAVAQISYLLLFYFYFWYNFIISSLYFVLPYLSRVAYIHQFWRIS